MIKWSTFSLLFILAIGIAESLLLGYSYFIIFASLLFFTVALDIVMFHLVTIPRLNAVSAARKILPGRAAGSFTVAIEFRNDKPGLLYFDYIESMSDGLTAAGERLGSVVLRGRGVAARQYTVSSPFFGRHQIGPFTLRARDPFCLCTYVRTVELKDHISVPPVIIDWAGRRGEPIRKTITGIGANTVPRAGQGYQFLSIRPYTIYDDSRKIAWNRFGSVDGDDVYVKEMEDERTTDTLFVIDLSSPTNVGQTDRIYCSEITSALRASSAVCKQGDRVGYLLYSSTRSFFVPPSSSSNAARQLQMTLGNTEPDGEFLLSDAIRELRKRFARTALTIVISPLISSGQTTIGRETVSMLAGRSYRLLVPEPSTYFEPKPSDAKHAIMRMLAAGRRRGTIDLVKALNGFGVRTQLSSSTTLLPDLSRIWYEGRYSYAGY